MNCRKLTCKLLLFSLIGTWNLYARSFFQSETQIIHFPVKSAVEKQNIKLEAKLQDMQTRAADMKIYFRVKGGSNYQQVDMTEGVDNFTGNIPAAFVKTPAMEYFIVAVLPDNSMITDPPRNPYYAPHEISIIASSGSSRLNQQESPALPSDRVTGNAINSMTILSPEPGATVNEDEAVVAVSYVNEKEKINQQSIKIFFDNKEVTSKAEITSYLITYLPPSVTEGEHVVCIKARDAQGKALEPLEWRFHVDAYETASPIGKKSFSGRVFFNAKSEKFSDSTLTTVNTGGNFDGSFGGIQYKGSAFITSREKPDHQPRNRFLFEAGTSWLGVRLGDTNPRFNDLILWGKRVRGIEGYIKLGFINLEFVQGETIRAIKEKVQTNPITGDTTDIQEGTFQQTLLGLRPSFGGGKNFQFGLNLLKVKDNVKSIGYGRNPKDNVVIGPDILFALDDHRIEIKAGAAFSLITNDISHGSIKKSEIDSAFNAEIPFDPAAFEDIFVLNTSTTPIDPTKLTSLAYNAQFNFNYFNNAIQVLYKSIGSDYNSLGNTFLRKNIRGYAVSDRVRLLQNQLHLTLGYENYLDGLDEADDGNPDTKPTNLITYNIGVAIYPRSLVWPKININFKEHNRSNDVDSLYVIDNATQDVSVQVSYDVKFRDFDNMLTISIIGSDRVDDENPGTANVITDIRMFSLRTKYKFPLTTVLTFATNETKTGKALSTYTFEYNQFGIDANYPLLNNKLTLSGGINLTSGKGTMPIELMPGNVTTVDYTDYDRFSLNLGASYQITAKQDIACDFFIINFDDKVTESYDDSIIRLRYELRY